ncbi:FKBP-type peptidyl-prolyl cis-trans isomerase [Sulfurospirillum cavolei]|uniref:FKBP-type peptidyl-prolyl cis-trans isomerase n=1 Tax=Sulfurospirillum cavolei TaxID=366522 RepID=UPI0005AB23D9|nr:peptidylprolyl isomerase [Sulfurospirillum cavolei]
MNIQKNRVVTLSYQLFDASDRQPLDTGDEPLVYLHGGYGDLFEKVEHALENKEIGDEVTLVLSAKESFGEYDENLVVTQPRSDFDEHVHVGEQFEEIVEDEVGDDESVLYLVSEVTKEHVILDGNHPFAGKEILFHAIVADVREASKEEIKEQYAR